jgi:hypothetical protein
MYMPNFIKIGSSIYKLIRAIHRHTDNKVHLRSHFFLKIMILN